MVVMMVPDIALPTHCTCNPITENITRDLLTSELNLVPVAKASFTVAYRCLYLHGKHRLFCASVCQQPVQIKDRQPAAQTCKDLQVHPRVHICVGLMHRSEIRQAPVQSRFCLEKTDTVYISFSSLLICFSSLFCPFFIINDSK